MSCDKKRFQWKVKRLKPFLVFLALALFFESSGYSEVVGLQNDDALLQEIQYLRQLKQENPSAYQQAVQEKRSHFKKSYDAFRPERRQKFHTYLNQNADNRRNRIQHIRQKDPKGFRQFKEHRLRQFERMKEQNPERFRQLVSDRPELRERFFESRKPGESAPEWKPSVDRQRQGKFQNGYERSTLLRGEQKDGERSGFHERKPQEFRRPRQDKPGFQPRQKDDNQDARGPRSGWMSGPGKSREAAGGERADGRRKKFA